MHTTKLIAHKGDNRIPIIFEQKEELITRFKKLNKAKWSVTYTTATSPGLWKTEQTCFLSRNY